MQKGGQDGVLTRQKWVWLQNDKCSGGKMHKDDQKGEKAGKDVCNFS